MKRIHPKAVEQRLETTEVCQKNPASVPESSEDIFPDFASGEGPR